MTCISFSVDHFIPRWPSKNFILIRCSVLHMQLSRHNEGIYDIIKSRSYSPLPGLAMCQIVIFSLVRFQRYRGPKFSVFPTWLPHHVTYDVIIIIKTFSMRSRNYGEHFFSIQQAVAEKNTKVLWGQTNKQIDKQTNQNTIPSPSARVKMIQTNCKLYSFWVLKYK